MYQDPASPGTQSPQPARGILKQRSSFGPQYASSSEEGSYASSDSESDYNYDISGEERMTSEAVSMPSGPASDTDDVTSASAVSPTGSAAGDVTPQGTPTAGSMREALRASANRHGT